jgi:S-adenosylmethionine-diacylglycerol 3-amino-3-carboxypropyl transferase
MKNKINGQVPLSSLIFTLNWEDPESDVKAIDMKAGQSLLTITSGGCNTLNFLLNDPETIYSIDINPAQTWLMEFKIAGIKNLSHDEFISLLGLKECEDRLFLFSKIQHDLSKEANAFWNSNIKLIKKGILFNGKFEGFVKIAGKMLSLLQGKQKIKKLLSLQSVTEQKEFYKNKWDNKRWRMIFRLMFNKKRLAKKGLVAEYFHFDDGAQSFSESFYNRARKALCDIPVKNNYFLSIYLTGKYAGEGELPLYLQPQHYEHIKRNIDRVKVITADTKYWLESMPASIIDGFCLSNICELMSEEDTKKLFTEVIRTARPGAKVCFRNLMIPREVPGDLQKIIVKNESLSSDLLAADRSFVYSRVAAYELKN